MNSQLLHKALTNLLPDLHFNDDGSEISEEELLLAIAARVADLMDREPGLLFSYLYRLDISEKKLNEAINTPSTDPLAYRIAEFILERQKERIASKEKYKSDLDIDGWEW